MATVPQGARPAFAPPASAASRVAEDIPVEWLRLYVECVEDRKLRRLPPAQRWLWIAVLAAARKSPVAGKLYLAEGEPYSPEDLADFALVRLEDVKAGLASFQSQAMVKTERCLKGTVYVVTNWHKRQFTSDSSTPRVRLHRERNSGGNGQAGETFQERSGNVSETPQKRSIAVSGTLLSPPDSTGALPSPSLPSSPPLTPSQTLPLSPPRTPLRSPSPITPTPARDGRAETKSGSLIDLVRAQGIPIEMSPGDHAALKRAQITPDQVAEAYCAAFRGEWGGDWLSENLNVQRVIGRWAGYQASLRPRAPAKPRPGTRYGVADLAADVLGGIHAN